MISTDIQLFRIMYAWGVAHPALAVFLGRDLIWVMVGVAAFFVIFDIRKFGLPASGGQSSRLWQILASVAVAYLVKLVLGLIRFRNRPFISLPEVAPLIGNPITVHAFPSGHAAVAFALAAAIFLIDKRWGWGMLILATLVAVGRVLVGVHFPLDAIVGAVIGSTVAVGLHQIKQSATKQLRSLFIR